MKTGTVPTSGLISAMLNRYNYR